MRAVWMPILVVFAAGCGLAQRAEIRNNAKNTFEAERYDAGQMTQAQYEAEKATAMADYNSRAMQRSNSLQ